MTKKYFTNKHKNNLKDQENSSNEQIKIKFKLTITYISNEQKNSSNVQKNNLNEAKIVQFNKKIGQMSKTTV